MSKALLLAIGLLAGAANAHAQQYLLRVSQDQNYQPLQNAQALTGNGWKHTQNTTLMLGFDFKYFGQTFNMVQENHNGVVSVDENGTNGFYAAKAQYDYRPK